MMNTEQKEYSLSEAELAGLLNNPDMQKNSLAVQIDSQAEPQADFTGIDGELKSLLETLYSPSKVIQFHYSTGDKMTGRIVIARDGRSPDRPLIKLYKIGNNRQLAVTEQVELVHFTINLLAADNLYRQHSQYTELSAAGILVFLAIAEHCKYADTLALLNHCLPEKIFTGTQVQVRLEQALPGDFRWPLPFFSEVLPFSVPGQMEEKELGLALEELTACGLLEAVSPGSTPPCFELSEAGEWMVDGILHEVSKLAITVAVFNEDGTVGRESSLFIRTPFDLLLFSLNGKEGILSTFSRQTLDAWLQNCFQHAEIPPAAVQKATPPDNAAAPEKSAGSTAVCPGCGAALPENSRFCAACGRNLQQKSCTECGKPLADNAKFCGFCGKKVS